MSGYSGITGTTNDQYKEIFSGPKKIEVPTDWDTAELSDIARDGDKTFIDGDWVESSDMVPNGEYQLIQLGNIGEGHFKGECDKFVSEEFFDQKNCTLVEQGDLLISRLADPVLRTIIVPEFEKKSITAVDIVVAKVDEENWSKTYIWQLLNSKPLADAGNSLATGSTRQRISRSNMSKITIPRPPLAEQRRIADILSTADEQIQQTDEMIEKTRELKQGLRQDILIQGLGEHTYKSVNIGPLEYTIPETWSVQSIPEIAKINPVSANLGEYEDTFEYVDIDSVNPGRISGSKTTPIEEAPSRAKRKVATGNVLVSTVRPYLRSFAPVTEEYDGAVCSSGFAVLDAKEGYDTQFLLQVILGDYFLKQMEIRQTGTSYPAVNKADFETIQILCPPLEEQRQIGMMLSEMDSKLEQEREHKQHLQELKRGLMQDLLTGKVRVDPEQAN